MPFVSRNFDVYVVMCDPDQPSPWHWQQWSRAAAILEPFAISSRGKASLRSTQILEQTRKVVRFGKLNWDDLSHQRWSHGSPLNADESPHWRFLSMEAWAPSWTLCEQEPPDFFLSLTKGHFDGVNRHQSSGGVFIAAMSSNEPIARRKAFRSAVILTARELSSPLTVWKERRWARPVGTLAFRDAVNDFAIAGLFKPNLRGANLHDPGIFTEKWNRIEIDDPRVNLGSTIDSLHYR